MDSVDTYRGVSAFRDDGEIGRDLLEAINQSKITIPIFTKGYASSIRCLNELTHIMECNKRRNPSIFPIFYDVAPDQVQEQSGSYEEAFKRHMNCYDANIIEGWKAALREVGALKGWELQHVDDEQKEKFIDLCYILRERCSDHTGNNFIVGIKDHVEEVMRLLEIDANDVQMVGIHGTSGVGKTTLAMLIYNHLKEQFVNRSFLRDIRETSLRNRGIEELQGRLLLDVLRPNNPKEFEFAGVNEGIKVLQHVDKKVLIVVDDVDHIDQLRALIPYNGQFAPGSKIIVTTRNKQVLDMYQVGGTYELNELQFNDALDLFHKHASVTTRAVPPGRLSVPYGIIKSPHSASLSSEIVKICGGLPLTVKVIGSFLSQQNELEWKRMLKKLRKVPCKDVQSKLRICYDALDHEVQKIFLDIACFFIRTDWRVARYMWEDGWNFVNLLFMSLVSVDGNELLMHDQLRDLGRDIVRQESYNVPRKRSRLWHSEEAKEALNSKPNTERIEAICLDCGYGSEDCCFKSKQFELLHNLRFLQLNKGNIVGDFSSLLPKLRWLRWHQCPIELMATNLYLKELAILDLSESNILDDWNGWRFMQKSCKLKVLILKSCRKLRKTPDFSAFPRLERLILDDCTSLNYIDPSIGSLEDLLFLSVKGCPRLEVLPQELSSLRKLTELHIDETRVKEIPTLTGVRVLSARKCESLLEIPGLILTGFKAELVLDDSGVCRLPESVLVLSNAGRLSLNGCKSLRELPGSIGELKSLVRLELSYSSIQALPDSIGELKSLVQLDLSYSSIHALPDSIGELQNLVVLNMSGSNIEYLPTTLGKLVNLEVINVSNCRNLNGEIILQPMRLRSLTAFMMDGTNITLPPTIIGILRLPALYRPRAKPPRELPFYDCNDPLSYGYRIVQFDT